MKGIFFKSIVSFLLVFCLLFTISTPVAGFTGVDSVQNFNNFTRKYQDGMTYKNTDNSTYWYKEDPNRAFIYHFYQDVFNISLYNLKMDYNSETVSTENEEDVLSFFENLTPGDYIFMEGYYAIFVEEYNGLVTLYDVGLPFANGSEDQIHYATYDIAAICNYTSTIKSYSPNSAGNKIHENQKDPIAKDFEPTWNMKGINRNNELEIEVGKSIRLEVITYSNGSKFDISDRMRFTIKNTSIADIDDGVLTGIKPGMTTITATGVALDLKAPLYLTVVVVEADNPLKDPEDRPMGSHPVEWNVAGVNTKNELILPVGALQSLRVKDVEKPLNDKIQELITYHSSDTEIAIVKDNKVIANNPGCAFVYMASKDETLSFPEPISVCVFNKEDMPKPKKQLIEIELLVEDTLVETIEINAGAKLKFSLIGKYDDGSTEDVTFKFIDHVISTNSLIAGINESYIITKIPGEFILELDNETGTLYKTNKVTIKVIDEKSSGYDNISGHEKSRFSDTGGHWAQSYIDILADNHIISGFEDGSFRPNEKVTLEQAVKMVINASVLIPETGEKKIDYWVSPWATAYVKQASPILNEEHYKTGFIGTYYATRSEIIDMVGLALNSPTKSNLDTFKDVKDIPAWAYQSFETLHANKIIEGDNFGKLNPKAFITRAEFSKIIAIAFNFI